MHEIDLFSEDFEVGDTYEFGSHMITAEEIMQSAERYDPQRLHLDPDVAEETVFGELIASGLHTLCVCCWMAVDELFTRTAVVAGVDFYRIRFLEPVRPGPTNSPVVSRSSGPNRRRTDPGDTSTSNSSASHRTTSPSCGSSTSP